MLLKPGVTRIPFCHHACHHSPVSYSSRTYKIKCRVSFMLVASNIPGAQMRTGTPGAMLSYAKQSIYDCAMNLENATSRLLRREEFAHFYRLNPSTPSVGISTHFNPGTPSACLRSTKLLHSPTISAHSASALPAYFDRVARSLPGFPSAGFSGNTS
jgi:hypothetical protein